MSASWLHHHPGQPGQQAMPAPGPLSRSPGVPESRERFRRGRRRMLTNTKPSARRALAAIALDYIDHFPCKLGLLHK